MMTRIAIPFVLALAASALAAGCGGGGGGGGTTTLSKAEYAAKLDAICAATNKAGQKLGISGTSDLSTKGDQAKGLLDKLVDKIDSLEPPSDVKDAANSLVTGLKKEASDFGDLVQAVKNGDSAKVKDIQGKLASDTAAASEDARFVGATTCARLL